MHTDNLSHTASGTHKVGLKIKIKNTTVPVIPVQNKEAILLPWIRFDQVFTIQFRQCIYLSWVAVQILDCELVGVSSPPSLFCEFYFVHMYVNRSSINHKFIIIIGPLKFKQLQSIWVLWNIYLIHVILYVTSSRSYERPSHRSGQMFTP